MGHEWYRQGEKPKRKSLDLGSTPKCSTIQRGDNLQILNADLPSKHKSIKIYPIGDIHIGDSLHDRKAVRNLIDEIQEKDNHYVILNGDIINNAVRHGVSDIYAEELNPNEQIDASVALLTPIKDKILAITEGNHEARTYRNDGVLIMYQVAQRLGIADRYSTGAYLLYVSFGKSQGRNCRKMVYAIYGKHGAGGGRKVGAKAIRLFEMAEVIDADCFVHSHTHTPIILRKSFYRVDYRNRKKTKIEQVFINTSGFMDFGGYVEEKGFAPSTMITPKLIFDGQERKIEAIM